MFLRGIYSKKENFAYPKEHIKKLLVKESHAMVLTHFAGSEDEETEACDLRTNPFQEVGDDGRGPSSSPTTRSMAKRIQED